LDELFVYHPKAMNTFIPDTSGLFPDQEAFVRNVHSFDAFDLDSKHGR